jgi:hypothetical protein
LVGGAWESTACTANNLAREGIWRFTPTQTGIYSILVYAFSANSINYNYPAGFYIKQAALGCNEQNWNCIGTVSSSVAGGHTPVSLTLGNLTAGTTYLIMADGVQPIFTAGYCYFFRIDCPNVCEYPKLQNATNIGPNSATINASCSSCFGNQVLEYGPAGFTPGTGAAPGAGGTAVPVSVFPYGLTGLATGSTYDVYSRQNCGGGNYSINCSKITFTTTSCNTAPGSITNTTGPTSVCNGTTVILKQNGGLPGAGGQIKWYSGTCGGVPVGTGDSLTVTPSTTTTYFARAESSCGNTSCAQITITVNALPPSSITAGGPVVFCAGGNVLLNANTGTGLTYAWKKYANVIAGASSSSYTATTSGKYKAIVTNAQGCSRSSNAITVTVNPLPAAAITANGPITFCAGDSVILSANAGTGLSYQWKKFSNLIAGATSINYTAKTAGKYKCVVTNSNGCSKASNAITVVVPCRIGMESTQQAAYAVYPNPSFGDVWIEIPDGAESLTHLEVFDVSGRTVHFLSEQYGTTTIKLSGLAPGIYFLQFNTGNTTQVVKLMISDN